MPEDRIAVAYPGVDPIFTPEGRGSDLGGPYILAVSTREPRKNLPTLIEGFGLLAGSAGADPRAGRALRLGAPLAGGGGRAAARLRAS